jgi:hypothetical protein
LAGGVGPEKLLNIECGTTASEGDDVTLTKYGGRASEVDQDVPGLSMQTYRVTIDAASEEIVDAAHVGQQAYERRRVARVDEAIPALHHVLR